MSEQLIKAAKIAFASQYSFYIKAHQFHWNVTGINFQELHSLFETIYSEVYESIDDFAEKIRALGAYAPGALSRFSMLSHIDDETEILPGEAMAAELLADCDKMRRVIKLVYDIAEQEGEHGFSNFLAERLDAFGKHAWMLRATTK
jgi:starvation-inducible DNA-binding protein